MDLNKLFNQSSFDQYAAFLKSTNLSDASIQRKLSSLASFQKFLIKKKYISSFNPSSNNLYLLSKNPQSLFSKIKSKFKLPPTINNLGSNFLFRYIIIFSLFAIIAGLGFTLYRQAILQSQQNLAYSTAANPITAGRFLSFQGRLTDSAGNPIISSTNIVFKLFNNGTMGVGTTLYTSQTGNSQTIVPDDNGIFSVTIGKSHGTTIPSSVFSENAEVWLEITAGGETMSPRQQIATVGYALNSETLQGLPPSASGNKNTVLVIDGLGNLNLGETSPTIKSTSGTLGIEGQAVLIKATDGSGGSITINPDASGTIKLITEGTGVSDGFINATNANLTSGNLFNATINNLNRSYNFINFSNYSVGTSIVSRFSVDAYGNTIIGNNLTVGGTFVSVGSSNLVTNLNSDLVDGYHASSFLGLGSTGVLPYVNAATNGTLTRSGSGPYTLGLNLGNANTWTALQNLSAGATISNLSVGGTFVSVGSTNLVTRLNADLLDGYHASSFIYTASNGLSLAGNTFRLGGLLTQNTDIGLSGFSLSFSDGGNTLVSFSSAGNTFYNPTTFTSSGDVSIAYDLNFTNSTASYIRSAAPLYIQAGEVFNSSDLILKTYNAGSIIFDSSNLWTDGTNFGIGTTAPTNTLTVGGNANTTGNLTVGGTFVSVGSNNLVTNLNADLLDGLHASSFLGVGATGSLIYTAGNGLNLSSNVFKLGGALTENTNLTIGNTSAFFINSTTGNVGIGTTAPLYTLDIGGTGSLRVGGSFVSVGSQNLVTNLNADLLDGLHGSSFLQVGSSGSFLYTAGTGLTLSSSNVFSLNLGSSNVWTALQAFTGGIGVSGNSYFPGGIWKANGTVGINTTAPAYRLDVRGTAATDLISSDMGFNINPVTNTVAPIINVINTSGNVDAGTHAYYTSFVTASGETQLKGISGNYVTTDASHGQVGITIPVSADNRVTARKIYRSIANSAYYSNVKLVTTISDNTTTNYTDNIADSGLTGTNYFWKDNTTSKYMTVNGTQAMLLSSNNTTLGINAGLGILANATSSNNTFIGVGAGQGVTTGSNSVGIGAGALGGSALASDDNVAVGVYAGQSVTSGGGNIILGRNSMARTTTGSHNLGFGSKAFYSNVSGSYNMVFGANALHESTNGTSNLAIGYNAGRYIADGSTGNTSPDYSLYLGRDTRALADNGQNEIVIGYAAIGNGSNSVTIGSTAVTKTILQGNVGIGTTNPLYKLQVNGNVKVGTSLTIGSIPTMTDGGIVLSSNGGVVSSISTSGWDKNASDDLLLASNLFVIKADSGTAETLNVGNTINFVGGMGLGSTVSSADTITFNIGSSAGISVNADTIGVNIGLTGLGFSGTQLINTGLVGVSNGTLTRIGSNGTYTVGLNLASSNTWTGTQTFNGGINVGGTAIFNSYVGIGTASPEVKLTVMGSGNGLPTNIGTSQPNASIRIGNTGTGGILDIGINGGSGAWFQYTNRTDLSQTYPLLFNPNGGSVGIGTTNPTYKLDVSGTGRFTSNVNIGGTLTLPQGASNNYVLTSDASGNAKWLPNNAVGTTYAAGVGLTLSSTNVFSLNLASVNTWTGAQTFNNITVGGTFVSVGSTNLVTNLNANYLNGIASNGFIGIGQTGTLPYVNNATNSTLTRTGTGGPFTLGLNLGNVNTWTAIQTFTNGIGVSSNSYFPGGVWNTTGSIGIGTTNPGYKLHVAGNGYVSTTLSIGNSVVTNDLSLGATIPVTDNNIVLTQAAGGGLVQAINTSAWDKNASDDYQNWVLQTNSGTGSSLSTIGTGNTVNFIAGTNITLGKSGNSITITSADINTTYTASNGLSLVGTDFRLGGLLTQNTDIGLSGFSLSFSDGGSTLVSFSSAGNTFYNPTTFTSSGDVSIAYDLNFTNSNNSNINTAGPFSINAGEVFNSSNLTLKTYNAGRIIFDSSNLWTDGTNFGIGTTNPTNTLTVGGNANTTGNLTIGGTFVSVGSTNLVTNLNANYLGGIASNGYLFTSANLFVIKADSGTAETLNVGNTINFVGGMGLGSTVSSADTITFNIGSSAGISVNNDTIGINIGLTGLGFSGTKLINTGLVGVSNGTLTRIGSNGTYTVGLNLASSNTWSTLQRFTAGIGVSSTANFTNNVNVGGTGYFASYVGIGTASPTALLDIKTSAGFTRGLRIGPQNTTTGDGAYIEFNTSSTDGYGGRIGAIRDGTGGANSTLIFSNTYSSSPVERMRITSNGSVGIGTTNPGYKLDVAGNANIGTSLTIGSIPLLSDNNVVLTSNGGIVSYINTSAWDKNASDDLTTSTNLFYIKADSGTAETLNVGNTINFVGGMGLGSTVSSADTITFNIGSSAGISVNNDTIGINIGLTGLGFSGTQLINTGLVGISNSTLTRIGSNGTYTVGLNLASSNTWSTLQRFTSGIGVSSTANFTNNVNVGGTGYFASYVGIGTASPTSKLQINGGDINLSFNGSWNNAQARNSDKISLLAGIKGRQINDNPDFLKGINGYSVYDNASSGQIAMSLIGDTSSPNSSGQILQFVVSNGATSPSPGFGGFYKGTTLCTSTSVGHCIRLGNRNIIRIWAKIPVGYNLAFASNSMGTGGNQQWISSTAGTGNWEEYITSVTLGPGASSTNFFNINGSTRPFTWYVAQMDIIDTDQVADVDRATSLNVGYKLNTNLGTGQFLTTSSSFLATDGGSVGIGTTNPTAKLTIAGNGSISTNLSIGGTLLLTQGASNNYILTSDASGNAKWLPNTAVGTTYAAGVGLTLSSANIFSVDYDSTLDLNGNKIGLNLGNANTWTGAQTFNNITVGGTFVSVGSTNLVTNLNANYLNGIASNGFIGIGQTGTLPYVNNATNSTLTRTGTGGPFTLGLNLGNVNTWTAIQTFTNGIGVSSNSYFPGGVWNTTGSIGIGTTNPGYKLHVAGNGYVSTTLSIGNSVVTNDLSLGATIPVTDNNIVLTQAAGGGLVQAINTSAWDKNASDDYQNWVLQTNSGTGSSLSTIGTGNTVNFIAGTNITLGKSGNSITITSADINTTYTASNGLSLVGTDFRLGGLLTQNTDIGLSGFSLSFSDGGSTLVSFSSAGNTFYNPTTFTSSGDVSIAYDLNFTNSTASYIRSQAPLYIQTESPYANLDLNLTAANAGQIYLNSDAQLTKNVTVGSSLTIGSIPLLSDNNVVLTSNGGIVSYINTSAWDKDGSDDLTSSANLFVIKADSGTAETLNVGNTINFVGGMGLGSTVSSADTITFNIGSSAGISVNANNIGINIGGSGLGFSGTQLINTGLVGISNGTLTRIGSNGTYTVGLNLASSNTWSTLQRFTAGIGVSGTVNFTNALNVGGTITGSTGLVISAGTVSLPNNQIDSAEVNFNYAAASSKGGPALTLEREDNRTISPNELSAGQLKFGFTSYNNNDSGPYADFLHFRSYTDSSGGNDNLLVINKSNLGMRLYQQAYGSATAYSTYKDIALVDNGALLNFLPKFSSIGNSVSITNSSIFDNGFIGIGTTNPLAKLSVVGNGSISANFSVGGTLSLTGTNVGTGTTALFIASNGTITKRSISGLAFDGLLNLKGVNGIGITGTGVGTSIVLTNTAVTPGSYGSGSSIPIFTVNAQGRLTSAGQVALTASINYTAGNGITLSGTQIKLGGALTENTRLNIGNTEVIYFKNSNGFVGIGTTNATARLTILGDNNSTTPDFTLLNANGTVNLEINTDLTELSNTFIGVGVGRTNTTGTYNTGFGHDSLAYNTSGFYNTAQGYASLWANNTGSNNTANGYTSLMSNYSGSYNTANGSGSLQSNFSGFYNTAQGYHSLYSNSTGSRNTALGSDSLYLNKTGSYNTAIGTSALSIGTTLYSNIALGYKAGYNLSVGSSNIFLGDNNGASGTYDNRLYIGNGQNPIIYGDLALGNVGIGTTNPLYKLDIRNTSNSNQLHLSGTGNDNGGYILGYHDGLTMAGDGSFNGTDWVAKNTSAAIISQLSGTIIFWTNSGLSIGNTFAPTARMTINDDGKVGIGTTNPAAILDVEAPTTTGTCSSSNTFNSTSIGYSGSYQTFKAPATGTYTIETWGAQGSNNTNTVYQGGKGAYIKGDVTLNVGDTLQILVGQQGQQSVSNNFGGNGGGGGSFVGKGASYASATVVMVAGGGGGAGGNSTYAGNGYDAVTTNNGGGGMVDGTITGGGTSGNGGAVQSYGAGGGGYTGNGIGSANVDYGRSFINGGAGGSFDSWGGGDGGFGGGGAGGLTAGGGGGYSGGGASGTWSATPPGGGGGSYNSGTNQTNTAGVNTGNGKVIISYNYSCQVAGTSIVTNGAVGIGTTSPTQKLDVVGIVNAQGFYINGVAFAGGGSQWSTTGANIFYNAGNVGIGNAGPGAYKLDVTGQINASAGLCIGGDCKTSWSQSGIGSTQWSTSGSNIYYNAGNVGLGNNGSGSYKLNVTGQVNASTGFCIGGDCKTSWSQVGNFSQWNTLAGGLSIGTTGSGQVGIGVTSTLAKLHVKADSSARNPLKETDFTSSLGTNATAYNMGYTFVALKGGWITQLGSRDGIAEAKTVTLYTGAGTILASASVNTVGTTAWTYTNITPVMLTVGSTYVVASYGAHFTNTALATPFTTNGIRIVNSTYATSTAFPNIIDTTNMYGQADITFQAENAAIFEGGFVGIGTTAPKYLLDVGGTINAVNISIGGSAVIDSNRLHFAANGSVGAPAYSFLSDTNTGMYRAGSDSLSLTTGGVQRLNLASNTFNYYNSSGTNQLALTNSAFTFNNSSGYALLNHTGTDFTVKNSSNVTQLSIDAAALNFYNSSNINQFSVNGNSFNFKNSSNVNQLKIDPNNFIFSDFAGKEGLRVNGGQVGIGVTSTLAKLHVKADSSARNPLKETDFTSSLGTNATAYNMGYTFVALKGGWITQLGSRDGIAEAKTVTLYTGAGTILASASVNTVGTTAWTYTNITPVMLTVGSTYVVASYGAHFTNTALATPFTTNGIRIVNSTYATSTAFPNIIDTTNMYGQADITFQAENAAIFEGGFVGIGTTAPKYLLDVGGTINAVNISIGGSAVIDSNRLHFAANGSVGAPAYSFLSDTNTGMYRAGSDSLSLTTGGVQRLNLASNTFNYYNSSGTNQLALTNSAFTFNNSSGYALLNHTGTDFTVKNSSNVTQLSIDAAALNFYNSSNINQFSVNGNSFNFKNSSNVNQLKIDPNNFIFSDFAGKEGLRVNGGQVGIGVTSTLAKLHVKADSSARNPLKETDFTSSLGTNATAYNMGYTFVALKGGWITQLGSRDGIAEAKTVTLYTGAGTILASASVNTVGTTAWTYTNITPVMLTVGSTYVVASYGAHFTNTALATPFTTNGIRIVNSTYATSTAFPNIIDTTNMYGQADITFQAENAAIFEGGFVGIGTTAPKYLLDVGGTINAVNISIGGSAVIDSNRLHFAANGSVGAPAYSFLSDTNTGMYRAGSDSLSLTTGGVQRLNLASNTFNYYNSSGTNQLALTNSAFTFNNSSGYALLNHTGTDFTVKNSSNVTQLSIDAAALNFYNSSNINQFSVNGNSFNFKNSSNVNQLKIDPNNFIFSDFAGKEGLRVNGGQVGIGVTSTLAKLHVKADSSARNPLKETDFTSSLGTNATAYNMGYTFVALKGGWITQLGSRDGIAEAKTVTLYTGAGTILASASVNTVGTTAWTYTNITPVMLTVGSTYVVASYGAHFTNTALATPFTTNGIRIVNSTYATSTAFPNIIDTTNMYGQADITFQAENAAIFEGGFVGIGTTAPGTPLSVAGLTGTTSGTYLRYYNNDFYYYSSSARYKNNIQFFDEDYSKILKIDPKIFTDKTSGERNIGLIAEEVDAAGLNHLVTYKNGLPDTVEYQLVSVYLLQLVKQQKLQLDNLNNDLTLTSTGQINVDMNVSEEVLASLGYNGAKNEIESASYSINDSFGNTVSRISQFSEIASAKIKTGLLSATNIITKNMVAEKIVSPKATIDHLTSTDIQTTSVTANEITTDNLTAKEATVSTLYADNIISKEGSIGELMTAKVSALRDELKQLVETQHDASPSGTITGSSILSQSSTWSMNIASDSAKITGDLELGNNLIVGAKLTVQGDTQLGNAFISGTFTAGEIAIKDNFIETTNTALYIQPSQTGSVHIMGDTLVIAEDGNIQINGNLTVSGSLMANLIVADQIQANKLTANEVSSNEIKIATDSAQTIIAESGFGAIATSSAKLTSNATAGTANLPAGKTEIVITNNKITANSMVYLTPVGSTNNQVPYIKTKMVYSEAELLADPTLQNYFTIALDNYLDKDIDINWWIIN